MATTSRATWKPLSGAITPFIASMRSTIAPAAAAPNGSSAGCPPNVPFARPRCRSPKRACARTTGRSSSSTRTATPTPGRRRLGLFFRTGTWTLHRSTPPAGGCRNRRCDWRAAASTAKVALPVSMIFDSSDVRPPACARQPDRGDRHVHARVLVKTDRLRPARQRAYLVDPSTTRPTSAISGRAARGMADDRVQLAAGASVGRRSRPTPTLA